MPSWCDFSNEDETELLALLTPFTVMTAACVGRPGRWKRVGEKTAYEPGALRLLLVGCLFYSFLVIFLHLSTYSKSCLSPLLIFSSFLLPFHSLTLLLLFSFSPFLQSPRTLASFGQRFLLFHPSSLPSPRSLTLATEIYYAQQTRSTARLSCPHGSILLARCLSKTSRHLSRREDFLHLPSPILSLSLPSLSTFQSVLPTRATTLTRIIMGIQIMG